jgi:hypothetical protein
MPYACPALEFAADIHFLKRLQNMILRTTGKFPKCTPVQELHMAFQVPYIYDYVAKLCRQRAEVIQNHENLNIRDIGKGETQHGNIRGLSFTVVTHKNFQVTR